MSTSTVRLRIPYVVEVAFRAACPACGQDCDWLSYRVDAATKYVVECCDGRP